MKSFYTEKKKKKKKQRDRIIRDIRTLFEQEDDYFKSKRASNFWNNNYIEYESNSDRNKKVSLKEYLEPYLRDITIDLQDSDTWKIQLTIPNNFLSSKDVEEEHVIHSKSNNIKCKTYNNANEFVVQLFKPLLSRHQGNLET